jgi:hypothetical protein
MFTEQQLQELLEIRKQIDALQAKYNAIVTSATNAPMQSVFFQSSQSAPPLTSAATTPSPYAPAPAPVPLPQQAQNTTSRMIPTPPPSTPAPKTPPLNTDRKPASAMFPPPEKKPDPIVIDSNTVATLKDSIISILSSAGKPLTFNGIYDRLQKTGAPLPSDKPMLVVRKLLSDRTIFNVIEGGLFSIGDASPTQPQAPIGSTQPPTQTSKPITATGSYQNKLDSIFNQQ